MRFSRFGFGLACLLLTGQVTAPHAPPAPQEQTYTVALTYQEWGEIAGSVRRSDTLTARAADDLVNKISAQVQAQKMQAPGKK